MKVRPILLYSHAEEPVTSVILSTSELDLGFDFVKLSLESLLKSTNIFDELVENEVKIQWTLSSGIKIINSEYHYLFNRVLSVPEKIFEDFAEEDRAYSISEFRAYLAFAIEAFPKCSAKPGAFGLSGNRYSLPRQWQLVKKADLSLAVPNYYLGDLSSISVKEALVYSSPYNYYYWKPNKNDCNRTSFAFERPKGIPVICCVIGNKVTAFPYQEDDKICTGHLPKIEAVGRMLAQTFNYDIAEVLLFSDDPSGLSFGMISNVPYASRKKEWFSLWLHNFLQEALLR